MEDRNKKKLLSPKLMKAAQHGLRSGYLLASDMAELDKEEVKEVKNFFRHNHLTDLPPIWVESNGLTVVLGPGEVSEKIKQLCHSLAGEFHAKVQITTGAIVWEGVGRQEWGEAIAKRMIRAFMDKR